MRDTLSESIELIWGLPETFTASDLRNRYLAANRVIPETSLQGHLRRLRLAKLILSQGLNKRTNQYTKNSDKLRPQAVVETVPQAQCDPRNRVERDYAAFRAGLKIVTPELNDAQSIRNMRRMQSQAKG